MTVAAVVLAAGRGERFDGATHKLLAPFRGRPLWTWAVGAAGQAGVDEVLVVTGAVDLDLAALRADGAAVRIVRAERWTEGQAHSLQAGVAAAHAAGHDAIVVGLADSPLVTVADWRAVAAAAGTPIAVATYAGQRRTPVRLAAEVWPLLPTEGDEGARGVIAARPDLVTEVPCSGEPGDIDTVEDLDRWS